MEIDISTLFMQREFLYKESIVSSARGCKVWDDLKTYPLTQNCSLKYLLLP